jgi:hypothetical protein
MRRSLIRSVLAIGLFVSIHAAAFAQNAPTSQPTPSDQSFIERLINRSLTNAGAARGGVLEPGYRAEQEHRADRVG